MRQLLVALLLAVATARAGAQVVERPEPFDSAGRLPAITPIVAARLQLAPPAWRITGDFRDARLYATGDGGWVVIVTRRGGETERYALTAADRDYLRARTANLPPGLAEQLGASVRETMRETVRATREALEQRPVDRSAFVIAQGALGLAVYAPSLAYAVTEAPAARVATYILAAGGTWLAASALSRELRVTPAQNLLGTTSALRGGLAGYGLAYAADASEDGRAAGILVGSLAGSAAGIWFGRDMTGAEVAAASFGADALALTTAGVLRATGTLDHERDGGSRRAAAVLLVAASVAGHPLGARYARRPRYAVTAGDVGTLWVSGGVGTLAAAALLEGLDARSDEATWLGLTSGFLAGVAAGDRLLVRRFDHSWSQAGTVLGGAAGGALMGAGVAALAGAGDDDQRGVLLGLAALGAIAGVGVADYLAATPADARHGVAASTGARLRLDAAGLALAASGVPGRHALLSLTF